MAIPAALTDREMQKFYEDGSGNVVVRTSATGTFTPQGLQNAGDFQLFEVTSTEWRELPVLTDRNAINIQNEGTSKVKIRYDNGGSNFHGVTIFPNGGERQYSIKGPISLWVRSESGTFNLNIEQLS